uniref:Uncharacterized protein n=1 Tax=Oryza punctata TaxID=4537 RepID=A0A0E0MH34_ORYPU
MGKILQVQITKLQFSKTIFTKVSKAYYHCNYTVSIDKMYCDSETVKDRKWQKLEKLQSKIKRTQSEKGKNLMDDQGTKGKKTKRRKIETVGPQETKANDIQISGSQELHVVERSSIQSGKTYKAGTVTSETISNVAKTMYDQYTLLNEDGKLVQAGQMSYTSLMQQIIQSPSVSLQANEINEARMTNEIDEEQYIAEDEDNILLNPGNENEKRNPAGTNEEDEQSNKEAKSGEEHV